MKPYSLLHLLSLILLFTTVIGCGNEKPKQPQNDPADNGRELIYERSVTFLDNSGNEISTIRAAVADEPQERNQGLMDVTNLPADAGMIFIFPDETPRSFYMANTPLSLDIMFVNSDSTIVRIHHNTSPYSSKQLLSGSPAKYVVETNGGYSISHDIQEGMKIRF
jgi:uncharacterized membrane protein (UPF0127 family)